MRILFWCDAFWPAVGGIPTLAGDLVAALAERGHELQVVAERSSVETPSRNSNFEVAIHRFPFLEALGSGDAGCILSLARSISEMKRDARPDLVLAFALTPSLFFHLHTRSAWPCPLLVVLHGSLPCRAETSQSVVGRTLQEADWVMTCSESCRAEAIALHPFVAAKCSLARNAVKHGDATPSRLRLDPPRLLFAGRLSHEKGADVAIAALPMVLERAPGARLRIAGDGALSPALRDQVHESGLTRHVDFLGFVTRDEMRGLMSESSVVLVPSRSEGFSLVALEAALAGRPVVASRVGGVPEVVIDGETGLLVAPDAPLALAAAIQALLDDPARALVLADQAHRRAAERFRWRDYVDAYEDRIRLLGTR